jgi:hypothetical protein
LAFGAYFISSWIQIRNRNAEPDPGDKSNAVPDPKHWAEGRKIEEENHNMEAKERLL